jgi:hypothetical protein
MPWGVAALAVGTVAAGAMSANAQKKAAQGAANAQREAAEQGIEEQRRQFDAVKELLSPYVNAGTGSLSAQQNILGLNGFDAQQQAMNQLQNSAQFGALAKQGEEGILANASATGGLRGGNVQGALAQFRPALLNQLIDQQYARLGGLTSLGQNAAAGVGNAGMQTGNAVTNLLQSQGAASAGQALANGQANAQLANAFGKAISSFGGAFGGGGFGGGGSGRMSNELF